MADGDEDDDGDQGGEEDPLWGAVAEELEEEGEGLTAADEELEA